MRSLIAALAIITGIAGLGFSQVLQAQVTIGPQLRAGGSFIGVGLVDIDADRMRALKLDSEHGVEVTKVQEGSPAEKAGIKAGDVLLTYNGENILGGQQLGRLVWETPQGRHVKIQYWRDGKVQTTTVITGAPPAPRFEFPQGIGPLETDMRNFARQMAWMDTPRPLITWKNRMLGIECEPLDGQLAQYFGVKEGVLIRYVDKNSPADKAGLRTGDVLTNVAGHDVNGAREISGCIRSQVGTNKSIPLAAMRDHKRLNFTVVLPENPE